MTLQVKLLQEIATISKVGSIADEVFASTSHCDEKTSSSPTTVKIARAIASADEQGQDTAHIATLVVGIDFDSPTRSQAKRFKATNSLSHLKLTGEQGELIKACEKAGLEVRCIDVVKVGFFNQIAVVKVEIHWDRQYLHDCIDTPNSKECEALLEQARVNFEEYIHPDIDKLTKNRITAEIRRRVLAASNSGDTTTTIRLPGCEHNENQVPNSVLRNIHPYAEVARAEHLTVRYSTKKNPGYNYRLRYIYPQYETVLELSGWQASQKAA